MYTIEERAKIQGYLSSVWGISSIIGPLLGGIFVEHVHWAWVFWMNIPIGILAICGVWLFLHEGVEQKKHSIDYLGSSLFLVAITSLMVVLIQGGVTWPWLSTPVVLLLVLFGCSAVLFIRQEKRAVEPLMSLALWKNRLILVSNLGA